MQGVSAEVPVEVVRPFVGVHSRPRLGVHIDLRAPTERTGGQPHVLVSHAVGVVSMHDGADPGLPKVPDVQEIQSPHANLARKPEESNGLVVFGTGVMGQVEMLGPFETQLVLRSFLGLPLELGDETFEVEPE